MTGDAPQIDLHYAETPNGWKISICLEELGLAYRLIRVLLDQPRTPEFLAISPNGRIPAIVDHGSGGGDPVALFESGAILQYLAERTGRLIPADTAGRYRTIQWLTWQVAGLGPMAGQNGHFLLYAPEPIPYAIERYGSEVRRLYGVLDRQLAQSGDFIAGDYSIADIACFPWIMTHKKQGLTLDQYPALKDWFARVRARPAVQRGLAAGQGIDAMRNNRMSDDARARLFGWSPPR